MRKMSTMRIAARGSPPLCHCGIGAGCHGGLEDTEAAVLEPEQRGGRIFHFDIQQAGRMLTLHGFDRPKEILEQIDVVTRLLRHDATVERPGAVPVILFVI